MQGVGLLAQFLLHLCCLSTEFGHARLDITLGQKSLGDTLPFGSNVDRPGAVLTAELQPQIHLGLQLADRLIVFGETAGEAHVIGADIFGLRGERIEAIAQCYRLVVDAGDVIGGLEQLRQYLPEAIGA